MLKIKFTPYHALAIAGFIALLAIVISVTVVRDQPWMGVNFIAAEQGLLVESVADAGPAAGILYAGDVLVEISDGQTSRLQLHAQDIIEDPDTIPTLHERDVFRERQSLVYSILQQPVVVLTLADGRTVRIQPESRRPVSSLSAMFWILSLGGMLSLLIGAAIWALSRHSTPARYLFISGLGTACLLSSINIFIAREIALSGTLFSWVIFFYHLGNNIFALGIIGLIWNFPRPLGRFPMISILVSFMIFFMLNEYFQWMEMPGNSVLFQISIYWLLGLACLAAQWLRSREHPVDRATTKLLTMTLLVLIFIIAATDLVSVFSSGNPHIPLSESFFALFAFYLILAVVVQRYHLFDIDRWWVEIWLWFFAGVAIILFDLALATVINMAPAYALAVSMIIAGWLYFPVRQWVWKRFLHHGRGSLEDHVPLLMDHFMRVEHADDDLKLWKYVLSDVFHPLNITTAQQDVKKVEVMDEGLHLRVPSLLSGGGIDLFYAGKGERLFSNEDVRLAQKLYKIAQRIMSLREPYIRGMLEERKRIMRDLHDDIGGRLLTLVHAGHDDSQTAAEALSRLREIIYSLDVEQKMTLNTAVARWRIEALERCEMAGISFEWHWQDQEQDIELSPRHFLNLLLIFREALTNVLKHAKAKNARFDLTLSHEILHISLWNNGVADCRQEKMPGKGLRNMRARTEELGGKFDYTCEAGVFCIQVTIPLNTGGAAEVSHA